MSDNPATEASMSAPRRDDSGVLGPLPRLSGRLLRFQRQLSSVPLGPALQWLVEALEPSWSLGPMDLDERPRGLRRPGVVATIRAPRGSSALAIGLETPLAHALVDRLLGFERLSGAERLQVTPVEWGVLSAVLARTLAAFDEKAELVLDHVGLEPFEPAGLGPVLTCRRPLRVGSITGTLFLWLPETLVHVLAGTPRPGRAPGSVEAGRLAALQGFWKAEAGTVTLPRGLGTLRLGGVQPIDQARLRGTPASPEGAVELAMRGPGARWVLPVSCAPRSGGGRVVVAGPLQHEPWPREALAMSGPDPAEPISSRSAPPVPGTAGSVAPADVPVTLIVELGRINLPVSRVASLVPGEVLELGRHAREPVELTSGGKLVARGELVQIDTELGVRLTNVFL